MTPEEEENIKKGLPDYLYNPDGKPVKVTITSKKQDEPGQNIVNDSDVKIELIETSEQQAEREELEKQLKKLKAELKKKKKEPKKKKK